jgi:hypothetical protein
MTMSDESNFKNPSLKKASGGMVWWKCPRCHGQDVFLGKRSMGSMGPIGEIGDSGNFMAVQRQAMVDVWVCRPCGEIATKSFRKLTESEIAEEKAFNKELMSGAFPFQIAAVLLFWLVLGGTILWLVLDTFSS